MKILRHCNCRKLLDSWTVATHSGELFCRNCYNRLFSTTSVKPTLPVSISPILPPVDRRDRAVTCCDSVSDCCYCEEDCSFIEPQSHDPAFAETLNWPPDKRRLLCSGEEEETEADRPSEVEGDKRCFDTEASQLNLRTSHTTICDQPSSPTPVTTWYNKHQSVSQSTFSPPSSAQRPSSTPIPGQAVGARNACNLNCSGNRRPGSPCRSFNKHRKHSKQCHRYHCHEFQRSDRTQVYEEQSTAAKEIRAGNIVQNYRNHLSRTASYPAMQNIVDGECSKVDIISFEHPTYQDHGNTGEENNLPDDNIVTDDDPEDVSDCEADARLRGGCGGGGGSGCCCSSGGGRTNIALDHSSSCRMRYQKERSSMVEGACGCSGRAKSSCGSGVNSGGCCSKGFEVASAHSPRVGGCCGTSCDESNEGACATKSGTGRRLTGHETCPPRSPDSCSSDPSSLSPCSAVACSPPCSGRKGCCPPAGCRPVRRRTVRCNAPCTGDTQSCGGGGCCGSGCRGGCGKPGQTCLPLRPCTIPPCKPHPRGGGSPCMPPRQCAPQPPCCRVPVIPGTLGGMSGTGKGGGSSCCRSGSPGGRFAGGGGCSPSTSCQQQEDGSPYDSCCQAKLLAGCECLGGGQDCQRCGRKVYQAEMQIASGVPYHNICFSCFCCRKPLETLTYHENCGEIYCKQCYVRNFGPQGYGYAGVLQTPM